MKIRQYRLSFSVNSGSAAPIKYDYWPRQRTVFLNAFQPIAERYRRRRRTGLYLMLAFMLVGFALARVSVGEAVKLWGFILLMTIWFSAIIALVFGQRLKCPACRKRLEPAKGLYCPQCGSDEFQHGTHRRGSTGTRERYCPSCDGRIAEEDGDSARSYKIRGCTHCGVMLDEMGL